jgi:hypothetical protein
MTGISEFTEEMEAVLEEVKAILVGKGPVLQGAVIGAMAGIWLHGHKTGPTSTPEALFEFRRDLIAHTAVMAIAWCSMLDEETTEQ